MDRGLLNGFVPAVVTPFTEGGEIMEDAYEDIVAWLLSNGAKAICVAGDNGESWTLSPVERGRLTMLAKKVAGDRAPVVTGCSAATLEASVAHGRAAAENGADAILSMPQTYVLKATRQELTRRFERLAQAVDLPIVAYNSPRRHGFSMSVDDVEAILDVAPVVGIKESSRDFFHHTHIINKLGPRISVMVGPCHYIFPGLALGAAGFLATGPEFLGRDAGRIANDAREVPGPKQAKQHYQLTVIYELLMSIGTWPSSFKAALNLIGQPAGVPRDPVQPVSNQDVDRIKSTFDHLEVPYG